MWTVRNKIIPFAGCKALTVWPLLFQRAKYMTDADLRHEAIHGRQQREMLCVGAVLAVVLAAGGCGWWSVAALPVYFWWYGAEYVLRVCRCWIAGGRQEDLHDAYRTVSFEREAYFFQGDDGYLERRRRFCWARYVFD